MVLSGYRCGYMAHSMPIRIELNSDGSYSASCTVNGAVIIAEGDTRHKAFGECLTAMAEHCRRKSAGVICPAHGGMGGLLEPL